jgi:hypothetical protein
MNRKFLIEQVDILMIRLTHERAYSKLSRRWRDGEIIVVHNDVETYTYDNTTINISLGNTMERNTIMLVMLHELTHIQLESTDHGTKFMKEFVRLRQIAEEIGIFTEVSPYDLYGGKPLNSYT